MSLDRLKAFLADIVFYQTGILCRNFFVYAHTDQPGGQDLVAFINHFRNFPTGIREIDKTFLGRGDLPVFPKIFHGNTDAGLFEGQYH